MTEQLGDIIGSKQAERSRLAQLTIDEKVVLLERLRDRSLAIRESTFHRQNEPVREKKV